MTQSATIRVNIKNKGKLKKYIPFCSYNCLLSEYTSMFLVFCVEGAFWCRFLLVYSRLAIFQPNGRFRDLCRGEKSINNNIGPLTAHFQKKNRRKLKCQWKVIYRWHVKYIGLSLHTISKYLFKFKFLPTF